MTIGLAIRFREASQGPAYRWWVLVAVECGNFVVYMDGFIVTLALPAMARQFGVGIHEIKWVLVAHLATLTVTLLLAGLADRWGRKPMPVVGVALLTLGAALCALAATRRQALHLFLTAWRAPGMAPESSRVRFSWLFQSCCRWVTRGPVFPRRFVPSMNRVGIARSESRTLTALRDMLLPTLISGDLRVKNAERVAARGL